MSGKISTRTKFQLTVEEELFQAADKKIAELNKLGVAQGRTDISEPERQHLPVLVDLGSFGNWVKKAKSYVLDKRMEAGVKTSCGKIIEVEDILGNVIVRGEVAKKCHSAMVLAPAGMGKTTLLRRIAQNARRGEYKELEDKLVLMLDFRPYLNGEKIPPSQVLLGDMFSDWESERMKQRYQWIIDNPEKVVFVMDSLDTLPFVLEQDERPRPRNRPEHHKVATADVTLRDILAKDWFPESLIISSSREYKVRNLHPSFRPDRCILLDGLTEESVQDLIDGFLGKVRGEEVKNYIKTECPDVWPLLSIPVVLVFSMIGFAEDGFKPKTVSGILIKFFQSLIRSSHAHVKDILTVFKKLVPLAFEGTRSLCFLFTPEFLTRFGLEPEEVTDLGILIPQSQGIRLSTKLMQNDGFLLYFNHQTQQEALAALHVLSLYSVKFKTFMEDEFWKQQFTVVRRFICGTLFNDEVLEAAQELTEIPDVHEKKNILIRSLGVALKKRQQEVEKNKLLELFIVLSECREGVAELIRSSVKKIDFSFTPLSPSDFQAIAFVMKQCEYLEAVILHRCQLNDGKINILMRTITPSNLKLTEFDVSFNEQLGPEGAHLLGKLVKNHEAKILDASRGSIQGCESVEKFIEGLGDAKMDELNLRDVELSPNIRSLLDLLPHIEKKLGLVFWKINESQRHELQQRLNEIGSPSLEVRISGFLPLKASLMDSTSDTTSRACPTGVGDVKDASTGIQTDVKQDVAEDCVVTDDRIEAAASENPDVDSTTEEITADPSPTTSQLEVEADTESTKISAVGDYEQEAVQTETTDETSTSGKSNVRPRGTSFAADQPEDETNLESTTPREKKRGVTETDTTGRDCPSGVGDVKDASTELQTDVERDVAKDCVVTDDRIEAAASGPCVSPNLIDVEELRVEIKENLTRPISTAKVIGKEGGAVRLPEGGVEFSSNAFYDYTTVAVTAKSGDADTPQGLKAISAALKCSTSGAKFRGFATVQLATYYNVEAEHIVVLCKKNRESQWERLQVPVSSHGVYVTFQVPHFCWYKIFMFWRTPSKVLLLNNFLFYNKKGSSICALTCLRDPNVKEECIHALEKKGFHYNAMPLPDNIRLRENEEMSYNLECQEPDECMIIPQQEVRFNSSSFTDSNIEIRIFRFKPIPRAEFVHVEYALRRPNEQLKVCVLPLEWGQNDQAPAIEPVVNDATASVTCVRVRGSTKASFTAHLRNDAIYPIQRKCKVLIINNDFRGTRRGSEVDVRHMMELWTALGCHIEVLENLTAQEMSTSCRRFAANSADVSAVIITIMTHGGRELNGTEYFEAENRSRVPVQEITTIFTSDESPHLRGKPKVFIFQACRGEQQDSHSVDANEEPLFSPERSDMLISFATQSGFTAIRHETEGSWFINAITNVFMKHAHDTHVMDMFTKVNNAVANKITEDGRIQISNQDSCMRRNLFLFPGWPN